jgi:U3 small nucleolar RNA-associated protein 3
MQEADFAFDESEWLAPKEQAGGEEEVVTEVLKEVEVTEDMGPEERYKLLQARYPEFDYLADEFRELQGLLPTLQEEAKGKPARSLEVIKSWLVGCYVAALASYFAILTSPSRDGDGPATALSPSELRDHEVMETLVQCREAWLKVKHLKSKTPATQNTGMLSPPEEDDIEMLDAVPQPKRKAEKLSKAERIANKKKAAEQAKKAQAVEQSLADLSTLLQSTKKARKAAAAPAVSADQSNDDNRSDFGEEEALDARTAADKDRRKKSLKFYTSQIVQKANKRAGAGRDAGGDMDIPYRERLVSVLILDSCKHVERELILTLLTERPPGPTQCRGGTARQEG